MFSRTLWIAFLTIALSSFTVQGAPAAFDKRHHRQDHGCNTASVQTVVRTVTVTARANTQTTAPTGKPDAGDAASTTKTRAAIATTVKKGNNGSTKTTSVASTSTGKPRGGNTASTTKTRATAATTIKKGNNGSTKTTSVAVTSTGKPRGGNNASTTKTRAAAATSVGSSAPGSTATAPANGGNNNAGGDPQKSLTLDPRVIATGFANNGQDVPTAGQVASLTSTNNFINFCLTVPNLPITDGKQITTGSCNPAPIGAIPSTDNMPSAKFAFPANFGTIKANTAFTIKMNIQNLETGFFVNAQESYFAAPQQLNARGQIKGHSHVVIEQLESLQQTTPTDPTKFAFFKGLNAGAQGGVLTADVTNGLPAGVYKLSSINTAANHQPAIVAVAQHGSLDDAIYFTVTADGKPAANANAGGNGAAATSAAEAKPTEAASTSAAAGKGATATASATASQSAAATGKDGKGATPGKATATATASAKETASVDPKKDGKETAAAGGKATATAGAQETAAAGGKGAGAAEGKGAGATGGKGANTTEGKGGANTADGKEAATAGGAGGKGAAPEKADANATSSAAAAPTEAAGGRGGGRGFGGFGRFRR